MSSSYEIFPSSAPVAAFQGRIALFDVDGTLVVSRSGRRFADSAADWTWFRLCVPEVLHELHEDGWTIALVSNQSAWTEAARGKIESILAALEDYNGWRPWCLVATGASRGKAADKVYRKPARGLYDILLSQLGVSAASVRELTMCGDAAGADDPSPAYRWAASDAEFAANVGAKFQRPCDVFYPNMAAATAAEQELVILVGNPGSGKSTTARSLAAHGYVHIEQDKLASKAATLKAVKAALATGASVVVDATHGSKENRAPYIGLLPAGRVRIVWHVRDGRPFNALREKPVPEIAYAVYTKHFADPRDDGVICSIVA